MKLNKAVVAVLFATLKSAWANPVDVVLLGDNSRLSLIKQCGDYCKSGATVIGTPPQDSAASGIATYSLHAKHAVIVVDATKGPLPITREHVQIARQAGVPSLSIMFVNMAGLEGMKDAEDLLELEEREVREVMNAYEMHGDKAMVFHDTKIKSIPELHTNGLGLPSAIKHGASVAPRRLVQVKFTNGKRVDSYVYLLSPQESKYTLPLTKSTPVRLWVDGQAADGAVISTQGLSAGESGKLLLETASTVSAAEGSRLLLEREGRIIAMGVVVHIGN
jgi:translation elongation factor EF-Tu-like GTPase